MMEPIGSGYYTPYFENQTRNAAIPARVEDSGSTQGSSGVGVAGFLSGNLDDRKASEKPENKRGPIGGILGGIWNGLKNTVKSLFTPKGLLMLAGFLALNFMTGGALTPIMFVLGAGVGSYQLAKGFVHRDWEGMGQGIFTLGSTLIGAKFDMYSVKNARTGEKFAMATSLSRKEGAAAASKRMPGFADNFRLVAGKKMQGVQGGQQNIYQVSRDNMRHYWGKLTGKSQSAPPPSGFPVPTRPASMESPNIPPTVDLSGTVQNALPPSGFPMPTRPASMESPNIPPTVELSGTVQNALPPSGFPMPTRPPGMENVPMPSTLDLHA